MANRDALHEIVAEVFSKWTRNDLQARAEASRIPLGAALSFPEVLHDEHLRERNMWQRIHYNDGDSVRSPRPSFVMAGIERDVLALSEIEEALNG